jgi:hypothetical protein
MIISQFNGVVVRQETWRTSEKKLNLDLYTSYILYMCAFYNFNFFLSINMFLTIFICESETTKIRGSFFI